MKDPKRLRDHADLPSGLHDALRGLAHNAPPAEAVERIQRSLNSLPSSPTPPSGSSLGWTASTYTLTASVGAILVAAIVWVRAPQTMRQEVAPSPAQTARAPAPQLSAAPDNAVVVAAPTAAQPVQAASLPLAAAPNNAAAIASAPARRPPTAGVVTPPPAPSQRESQHLQRRARESARAHGSQANEAAEQASHDLTPSIEAEAAANAATARSLDPQARTTPRDSRPLPAPEDEASLLYRAKQATRSDHKAAFRLLDLHAQYFPNGALVEEREVLAIDLLRRMGRAAQANERALRFLARFPTSSYRNAVER